MNWDVRAYDSVDSTNMVVKRALAEGCAEGFAACALEQTQGYGRQGRLWKSPRGGLYVSFALRPNANMLDPEHLASIGPVMGLAVAGALRPFVPEQDVCVKWPNDVMCGTGKLAGISAERVGEDALCIGIGVNVFEPEGATTRQMGRYKAAYLFDFRSKKEEAALQQVRDAILESVGRYYETWAMQGFAPFREELEACLYAKGQLTALEQVDGTLFAEGVIEGVDEQARLLIRSASGEVFAAHSGEVHTRF